MPRNSTTWKTGQSANPHGRPKGAKSKTPLEREARLAASGMLPLDFFLAMMRDKEIRIGEETYQPTMADRQWGAEKAAPYIHPKLAAVKHSGGLAVRHENWVEQLQEPDDGSAPAIVKVVKFSEWQGGRRLARLG